MSKDASDLFPPKGILGSEAAQEVFRNTYTRPTGYHLSKIERGKYGERSKILEEMAEVEDAHRQGNSIMLMLELSDLVGACVGYLEKRGLKMDSLREYAKLPYQHMPFANLVEVFRQFEKSEPVEATYHIDKLFWYIGCYVLRWNLRFADVVIMMDATHRAFETGHRKPK